MFERFTERARQVVVLAQEEARILKHNYIGTEHLLLGLLREDDGVAARALKALDLSVESVRAQVVKIIGRGQEVTGGQIPKLGGKLAVLQVAFKRGQVPFKARPVFAPDGILNIVQAAEDGNMNGALVFSSLNGQS